jgi:phage-related protein
MASVDLIVRIITDATKAADGIDKATSDFDKFSSGMQSLAIPAAAVATGVTAIGIASVNAASDVQQAFGALDAVFGESSAQVKQWASDASSSVGLSTAEYSNFAATIGAQLKNLGVPFDQVAGNTDDLIRLGADLAATYGGTTTDAVNALGSALRGEADPAERYGLALNQTAVNAALAEQGLSGLEGEALTAAKAQTIMGLATEQAGGALGQFGRESDTVAGQTQQMQAQWANAAAALGAALLPAVAAVTGALGEMANFVQQNSSVILPLLGIVGALAAVILLVNGALIAYNAVLAVVKVAQTVATAAQWAWNAALTANPIGIIIAAVAALVGAFIYLWNTNEDFRNFFIGLWTNIASFFESVWAGIQAAVAAVVDFFVHAWNTAVINVKAIILAYVTVFESVFNGIRAVINAIVNFFVSAWTGAVQAVNAVFKVLGDVFSSVLNAILTPIRWVVDAFNNVVGAIKNVINWLGRIKIPDVFGAIGNLLGGGARSAAPSGFSTFALAPAAAGFSARSASFAAPAAYASTGGAGTTINVNGGLDSADTIARRIEALLVARQRRTGGVQINRGRRS